MSSTKCRPFCFDLKELTHLFEKQNGVAFLDFYSPSHKALLSARYRQISKHRDMSFALKFDRRITSTIEALVKFNILFSRLRDFAWSYDKSSYGLMSRDFDRWWSSIFLNEDITSGFGDIYGFSPFSTVVLMIRKRWFRQCINVK